MIRLFKNELYQDLFEQNGFVKLPNILSAEDIHYLKEAYFRITQGRDAKNTDYGVYYSYIDEESVQVKKELSKLVYDILVPKCMDFFHECKANLGGYLIKAPGPYSYTVPHQDWTMVELDKGRSLTVWIPLADVDKPNGALGFIRGSHQFLPKYIGAPSPAFQTVVDAHRSLLYEYLEFVPLKAGEPIVFDKSTIHGATPNSTATPRMCVGLSVNPTTAPLCLYYQLPETADQEKRKIARLLIDEDFFFRFPPERLLQLYNEHKLPEGYAAQEIIEDEFREIGQDDLIKFLHETRHTKNGHQLQFPQHTEPKGEEPPQPTANTGKGKNLFQRLINRLSL